MRTRYTVGDITVHRLVELEAPFMDAFALLPDLTAEQLEANRHWLRPAGLDAEDRIILCIQSFLVETPHHLVLVDSCIGNDKPRPSLPDWHMKTDGRFAAALAAAGHRPEDIDYVLCTHLHSDHVGWNTRLLDGRWVPTFPNARYVFAAAEYEHWRAADARAPVPAFQDSVLPVVEAGRAEMVASDHAIGDHVRLMPTPGHTPGHVAVALGRGQDAAVVSGDLIHSPLQARYPGLSQRFDADRVQAAATRRAFLERYCGTGTLCCMTHFPSPSAGRIKPWGEGFVCAPVEAV